MGKDKKELTEAQRAALAAGRKVRDEVCERDEDGVLRRKPGTKPQLSDDKQPDLEAMEHVWDGREVVSRQQQGFADLLEEDGRAKFWDRMQALKKLSPATTSGETAVVQDVEAPFPELEEAWGQFQEWCKQRES